MSPPSTYTSYERMVGAVNRCIENMDPVVQITHVYDCCSGSDNVPRKDRKYNHWGGNTYTAEKWSQTSSWRGVLQELEYDLAKLSASDTWNPSRPINMLFLCKSGRHRSVASAMFAAWILHTTRRFKVGEWEHLCSRHWRHDFCTTCSECAGWTDERQALNDDIVESFYAL